MGQKNARATTAISGVEDCAGRSILREFRPDFRLLIYPADPQAVKNSSRENGLDVVSHSLIGCRCEEEPGQTGELPQLSALIRYSPA